MNSRKIKKGQWYETRAGIGQCVDATARFPAAFKFDITAPLPGRRRGEVLIVPRDVLCEVPVPDENAPHKFAASPNWSDCCRVCGEGESAHQEG